jgi:DHA1 family tetracycline resistance protein-like MFS transporter
MEPDPQPAVSRSARRAGLLFILVTVTIDMLAFSVIIPVLPHLVQEMVGGDLATASIWSGVFSTVFALTQFVCSPIQGALSDRFGRRPVILLSCLGLGLDFALMALVPTLSLLLVGRVISGMTAASFSTANAYIADVTPPERRGGAYGMIGAAFGIGFVAGPAFGSLLAHLGTRAPFWGAAALALCNFLYGLLVLPESLPPERRTRALDWSAATPLRSLLHLRRYPQVFELALVILLFNTAHFALPATFVLYADYRYQWGARTVGYVLAAVGISGAIVQAGLAGRVVARLGERRTVVMGCLFGVAGFAIYGLAPSGGWFVAGIPVMALWGLASPATQALMSRQVDATEQGRLQGAVTSLASLAGIFAPLLYASLFAAAISPRAGWHLPGVAYLVASALVLVAGVVAWTASPAGIRPAQTDPG